MTGVSVSLYNPCIWHNSLKYKLGNYRAKVKPQPKLRRNFGETIAVHIPGEVGSILTQTIEPVQEALWGRNLIRPLICWMRTTALSLEKKL
ncbi:hypothetical protein CHARACLAT_023256 [Characodon lateralis]|uniref:Uncharacterized protein n=1 Tax=Characodon lateralis TaxID=208331 RepID=A0ABU7CQI9_9TELE|nr:hypothetical protein [Characodon lateralis]